MVAWTGGGSGNREGQPDLDVLGEERPGLVLRLDARAE